MRDPREFAPEVTVRRLGEGDIGLVLGADGVFDHEVQPVMARRFLAHHDHHLFGAIAGDVLVGFVSTVMYLHPDKPVEHWINEAAVHPDWQRQGIGRRLLLAALDHGWSLGCAGAWVLTHSGNDAARGLYAACGGQSGPVGDDPDSVVMVDFAAPGTGRL